MLSSNSKPWHDESQRAIGGGGIHKSNESNRAMLHWKDANIALYHNPTHRLNLINLVFRGTCHDKLEIISAQAWRATQTKSKNSSGGCVFGPSMWGAGGGLRPPQPPFPVGRYRGLQYLA